MSTWLAEYQAQKAQDRRDVRAAMKWWRAQPENARHLPVRLVNHGFYGHVVWTTNGEAGHVATVHEVIKSWKESLR